MINYLTFFLSTEWDVDNAIYLVISVALSSDVVLYGMDVRTIVSGKKSKHVQKCKVDP